MNQTKPDLLDVDVCSLSYWEKEVVKGENLFHDFLQSNDLEKSLDSLRLWLNFFNRELRRGRIDEKTYNILRQQWKHGAKLFVCASFVEAHRESFSSIKEAGAGLFLSEKIEELAAALFTENIEISRDEAVLFSSIFYEKSLPSESRQIPFATALDGKGGRINILELRRIKSHRLAIQNPCIFPHVNAYTDNSVGEDFSKAIDLALQINVSLWNKEKTILDSKIKDLDALPKEDVNKSELNGLKKDLSFMNSLGDINRYGILWDVKPYELSTGQSKAHETDREPIPPIDGKSIGLAAFFGIYFTLRDKFPDERAIYSAALDPNDGNKLIIMEVDSIPEKVKAAIEINHALSANPRAIPPFDGFGIHKNNWNSELSGIIENEQFQIFVLDDDGSVVKTYPEKSKAASTELF